MNNEFLASINKRICDRTDCFYWQTDRKITAEEQAAIWVDRHSSISSEEMLEKIKSNEKALKMDYIEPFDLKNGSGNVNSIRIGVLESGEKVIIRCHPKGLRNGYYHVESLAAKIARQNGILTFDTYVIHDLENEEDISYQITERLKGEAVFIYLKEHPEKEEQLFIQIGKIAAQLHKIPVEGYGPFDNEAAKNGKLIGIHKDLTSAVKAGLGDNLDRLVKSQLISNDIAKNIRVLFENNKLLKCDQPVLIHNDLFDGNLLTDGETITGLLDWDECVGGHPIEDIACRSLFYDPEKLKFFLKGYFSETEKYENFDDMFQLMRLRYTISKMALRIKRYTYDKSEFVQNLIRDGMIHLENLIEYFDLNKEQDMEKQRETNNRNK